MADNAQNSMEKAQSRFLETQKKNADRSKAAAEYLSEAKARDIKTAKLRALRLAKEEADRIEAAAKPAEAPKKRASRAVKPKT